MQGEILKEWRRLKDDRQTLDNHLQEIAERIYTDHALFNRVDYPIGQKRKQKVFDSTAALALPRFAAAFTSMITPDGSRWHGMSTTDRSLNKSPRVRAYFDDTVDILFRERYRGGFGSQIQECYMSLGAFGSTTMLIEPSSRGGLYYRHLPLHSTWFCENAEGRIDRMYRNFKWSGKQVMDGFPDSVTKEMIEAIEANPDKKWEFVHCIKPNKDIKHGRMDYIGMPYASYYVCVDDENFVDRGGYRTFPAPTSRYAIISGEQYGTSPAMSVLPDIKMLNEMEKTRMRQAHLATSPPWLLNDDLMGNPINFKPDALNYGGINSSGQQMIQPMITGANHQIATDMTDQKRQVINDAFGLTLFQILVESHTMSATEVIERAREKGALLGPMFSRQTTELIEPIIERELDLLARQNKLPQMPPELIEARGEYEVVFDNPLSRAQKSEPLVALARNLEMLTPVAQIDPTVLDNYDWDEIARDMPEILGTRGNWVKTVERRDAERQQQAYQQEQQALLQAAPILAEVQKKQAEAQQIAQAGPTGRV